MAVVSMYNSKQLYFPETLLEKLNTIQTEALTIVEAPLGYGKTTAIRHFFEESDLKYVWINADTSDKYRFFDDFCLGLKQFDENISDKLKASGYPVDEEMHDKNVSIIRDMEIKEKSYIIIDNYQNISERILSSFIYDAVNVHKLKLHIVLITQVISDQLLREKVYNREVYYISKSDFEFTEDEIVKYYRKCGIKITRGEAEYLQRYADGWISAIYLQMLNYIENKTFESNIGINQLISELFWEKLNIRSQDLLIKLSLFDMFTLRQAVMMAGGTIGESEIRHLLTSNKLIYYDNIQRKYYIHGLMRYFLKSELDKMDSIFSNEIYVKAGNWYVGNKQYIKAIKVFYGINDYKSIYEMNFCIGDIEEYVNGENKEMFLKIVNNTPMEVKAKCMETAITLCLVLFIYHEKDFFASECKELERCIEQKDLISNRKNNILKGECEILNALNCYNNLEQMKEHYRLACEYMKSPSNLVSSSISWTFKTPSVLNNIYRSDMCALKQLEVFEDIIPFYYKLTGGQGKGAEALMKAEIFLNQMDFDSSEILCHKALYMAETRSRFNIYIAAMFCLARISVYKGDFENITFILNSIVKRLEETRAYRENIVVDMAESYIKILKGKVFDISGWLKDNVSIEKKCVLYNLGFANIIFGRFLLEKGDFVKFAGISGQMLGIAGIHDNVMYKIYTLIYISVADYQLGQEEKAVKFLNEAVKYAYKDRIYLPFIENIHMIKPIIKIGYFNQNEFINNIYQYEKLYGIRFKIIRHNEHGLTRREEEIAKLAAERYTNREISMILHISENTVKSNLKSVFNKMEIKSRSELNKYL